jgi:hypothetical protein
MKRESKETLDPTKSGARMSSGSRWVWSQIYKGDAEVAVSRDLSQKITEAGAIWVFW